jgi:uncharacterized protein YukE
VGVLAKHRRRRLERQRTADLLIRAQAASLEAEHQAIIRDVLAAGDFWGGAGSVACQEFITQLGRNFQVIYQQANAHGSKVQTAGNNMASTDSAVGSSWA